MRRTKIVATLGPATDDPDVLDALLEAGVDVVRLNAAHSDPAELATRLAAVRAAEKRCGVTVGVLLDLPGPKLRVGEVASGTLLVAGERFVLHAGECVGDAAGACVSYGGLADDVSPATRSCSTTGGSSSSVVGLRRVRRRDPRRGGRSALEPQGRQRPRRDARRRVDHRARPRAARVGAAVGRRLRRPVVRALAGRRRRRCGRS